ncbi:hypothetical protein EIP91_000864 [Steccherinum ochraceum]|uniref:Uncharacterized protein n=1 Tax=Steccherinum ochraceum TaxID=92696 RepID=A0A4V2MXP4_9APHY|nr:hypothetical protein EIP91_000864 [Steccherinum ochraceum]
MTGKSRGTASYERARLQDAPFFEVYEELPVQYRPSTENRSPFLLNYGLAFNYKDMLDFVLDSYDPSEYKDLPPIRNTSAIVDLGIDLLIKKCDYPYLSEIGLRWPPIGVDFFIKFHTNYTVDKLVRKMTKRGKLDRVVSTIKQALRMGDEVKPMWYFAMHHDYPYGEYGWELLNQDHPFMTGADSD